MRFRLPKDGFIRDAVLFAIALFTLAIIVDQFTGFINREGLPQHERTSNANTYALGQKAEKGDLSAIVALADHYQQGTGGLWKDKCTALMWYDKAARMGAPYAQLHLSDAYFMGLIIDPDPLLSYYWAKQAERGGLDSRLLSTLINIGKTEAPVALLSGWSNFIPEDQPPLKIRTSGRQISFGSLLFQGHILGCY